MKKILLVLLLNISAGICLDAYGQNTQQVNTSTGKTRTVYLYIVDMDTESESTTIEDYLGAFPEKIISSECNKDNQMCSIEVRYFTNDDLIEIIDQVGFKALVKQELPPEGQRYIYNPDGTWKIKAY